MKESRLRFEIGSVVVPGDRLGPARSEFAPGPGTVRCVVFFVLVSLVLGCVEVSIYIAPSDTWACNISISHAACDHLCISSHHDHSIFDKVNYTHPSQEDCTNT